MTNVLPCALCPMLYALCLPWPYGCKNYLSSLLLKRFKQLTSSPSPTLFINQVEVWICFSYLYFYQTLHIGKIPEVLRERGDHTKLFSPQFFWMRTLRWNPWFRLDIHLRALGQEVYIFTEIQFSHLLFPPHCTISSLNLQKKMIAGVSFSFANTS